jgi:CRP-like cAMP-binding protein
MPSKPSTKASAKAKAPAASTKKAKQPAKPVTTPWELLTAQILRFLPDMPEEDLDLLKPHVHEIKLKKGQAFAEEGKVANEVGLVLEGNMRQYYMQDGQEKTTYFYFEHHLVSSYISCISGKPSPLTIEAITPTRILVFPYNILKTLFDESHFWERFGRLVAEYLALGLEERMVSLLILSPEQRYDQLISGSRNKIIERIPQHYIANYLGITPVSLSRIRNRVAKK